MSRRVAPRCETRAIHVFPLSFPCCEARQSADGTWAETTSYNVTSLSSSNVSTQNTETSGTYVVGTTVITFTRLVGGALMFTGSVTGITLYILDGGPLVYSR